jgi:hypothetical protein
MDDKQFAEITKAMGRELTRRGAMGRLAAGVLAAAGVSRIGLQSVGAQETCTPTTNPPTFSDIPQDARDGSTCSEDHVPSDLSNDPDDVCSCLGFDFGFKYNVDENEFIGDPPGGIDFDINQPYLDWSTTGSPLGAVVMKGGPLNNVYTYNGATSDTCLVSPDNDSGGPAGLSHVIFCWNKALEVTKGARTEFDRDWDWTIEKSADQTELTLSPGQTFDVNYEVTVEATSEDDNFVVKGTIIITNPNPTAVATITEVTDVIKQGDTLTEAEVNCQEELPAALAGGGEFRCRYTATLETGANGVNTATVTTSGTVAGGSGKADVVFGDTPTNETDECVDVSDTFEGVEGDLGTVCAGDQDKTFNYTRTIVANDLQCGENDVDNTASFETNDTGETGSDDWTVVVNVACDTGCTLTQGYWKTHSEYGPAKKRDAAWDLVGPDGEDSEFFGTGKSWYDVLWTAPGGDPYYNLAHQYIAAKLNILNGTDSTTAVDEAIAGAEAWFAAHQPGETLTKAQKKQLLDWATTLDNYNNGDIGPGHCSEVPEDEIVSAQRAAGGGGKGDDNKAGNGKKRGKGRGKGKSKGRGKGKN